MLLYFGALGNGRAFFVLDKTRQKLLCKKLYLIFVGWKKIVDNFVDNFCKKVTARIEISCIFALVKININQKK